MVVEDLPGNSLREQIRRVLVTLYFEEGKIATPQALLDPKLAHRQVSHASDAAAATDSNCCGRVRMHTDLHAEAE